MPKLAVTEGGVAEGGLTPAGEVMVLRGLLLLSVKSFPALRFGGAVPLFLPLNVLEVSEVECAGSAGAD